MSLLKVILIGSVVVNAGLLTAYVIRDHRPSENGVAIHQSTSAALEGGPTEIWTGIEAKTSGDFSSLVEHLRAEGFPPILVRAIVHTKLWEQFEEQRNALRGGGETYEYWKNRPYSRTDNAEIRAAQRKLYKAFTDQVRELVGDDTNTSIQKSKEAKLYGSLPADKIEQLKLITQDYSDLKSQIQSEARGLFLPEDREKLAYLEKEQRADVAALLTPDEIAQYELRNSRTANQLKARINLFDPSEQEYVALFKLQKAYDDAFAQPDGSGYSRTTGEQARQRLEAQKQLNRDIETALGSERYRDYVIKTDYEYRQVTLLTDRLKLPDTAAAQVVSLKLETKERLDNIMTQMRDRSRNSQMQAAEAREQLQSQTAALAQEVAVKLEQVLGPEGYAAYKSRSASWFPKFSSPQSKREPKP